MIYRPFDLEPFTKGIPQGTALLLRKLRGEALDWSEIENKLIPKQTCRICKKRQDRSKFATYEFKKKEGSAVCLECMEDCKGELDEWTHHFCEKCDSIKPEHKFTLTGRQRQFFRKVNCADCYTPQRGGLRPGTESKNEESKARKLVCRQCHQTFDFVPSGHITKTMRKEHLSSRERKVLCYECYGGRPTYTCNRCGESGHREDFQKTHFEQDCQRGTQQCLECKTGKRKGKICIVDVCKKFIREESLSNAHKRHPSRAFVCDTCTQRGYTTKNAETYTCSACKKVTGGHGLFQEKNFQRAAERGTQKCKGCFQ